MAILNHLLPAALVSVAVLLEIHVRPGSSRSEVGGSHDGVLVVRVRERAVDGRATTAALEAVAGAFGVAPRQVRLVRGATSRRKLVEIDSRGVGEAELESTAARLAGAAD